MVLLKKKMLKKGSTKMVKKGGGAGFLIPLCFLVTIFCTKTSKNAMKHMILSFKMKGDVISDHFLMLWFQKDSLDTIGFSTFRNFFGGEGPR